MRLFYSILGVGLIGSIGYFHQYIPESSPAKCWYRKQMKNCNTKKLLDDWIDTH